jgi:poly(3-hydroxybutyrate) depolymerase
MTVKAKQLDATAARARAIYDLGATSVFACRSDPRFSYCLYVPTDYDRAGTKPELVVAVHGTGRTFITYRDALSAFGRWRNCIVLCPLFPIGVLGDGNRDGFKYMQEGDIRYDLVLLDMVAEVEATYAVAFERFSLFGYSGGGHFANRFYLLHPERLFAVSIGAAGSVTLLDETRDWWVGVRGLEKRFGKPLNIEAMRKVAVQLVVGAADLETWEITHKEGGRHWMPGANDAGRTRPERLASLKASLEKAGVATQLDLIPNLAHDGIKVVPAVEEFLAGTIDKRRGAYVGGDALR